MIKVYLVDDHQLFAECLTTSVNTSENIRIIRSFTTIDTCRQALTILQPDIILLDISMPDGNGVEFCREIITTYPTVKVIALTCHNEYSVIRQILDNGVCGYILKNISNKELLSAIEKVHQGECYICDEINTIISKHPLYRVYISSREKEILKLLINGNTSVEIAKQLFISTLTVKWHRKNLLVKFGVKNTSALISLAIKEKLV